MPAFSISHFTHPVFAHAHTHTHTHTHTYGQADRHGSEKASKALLSRCVWKLKQKMVLKQEEECLRQTVPNRWTSIRKTIFQQMLMFKQERKIQLLSFCTAQQV